MPEPTLAHRVTRIPDLIRPIAPHHDGPGFDERVHPDLLSPKANALRKITEKWNQTGQGAGAFNNHTFAGIVEQGDGYYMEFANNNSRIYYRDDHGANWVYGAIALKYYELGGSSSWLGWPTSDEQAFVEGGRVTTFEHGAIYWWPDTGAIDVQYVSVKYAGLYCFGETDDDSTFSNSDEPYVIIGVVTPTVNQTTRTQIYDDVDNSESREDNIELYNGMPLGMTVSITLMEHDYGNPDQYKNTVKVAVGKGSDAVVLGIGAIPYVGPWLAPVAEALLKDAGPAIVDEVNALLGTDDDALIRNVTQFISAKQMVQFCYAPTQNLEGILWHIDSPLLSGDGSSYKIYYNMTACRY